MAYTTQMTPAKQQAIQKTLMDFHTLSFPEAATALFQTLGYGSLKRSVNQAEMLFETLKKSSIDIAAFQKKKIQFEKWKKSALLFQLTDKELPAIFSDKNAFSSNQQLEPIDLNNASSILFLTIELEERIWYTEEMEAIAKEMNRHFVMPIIFLFQYGPLLTLLIQQKENTHNRAFQSALIRNLRILHPTYPHTEMLSDLDIRNLKAKKNMINCIELFDAWFDALSAHNRKEKTFLQKAGMLAFI